MELVKIVALGVTCALIIVYLKGINGELAMIATVCSGILLLSLTISYVSEFISAYTALGEYAEIGGSTIKIVLKIIGISYLVEFSSNLIEDFGLKSLSDKVVFAGKAIILITSYPIIENLIKIVTGLI